MQLHYRPWSGTPRPAFFAIWPIARVALRLLLRRRLFWVLYACALLIFFMFFFGSLFLDWAQGQMTDAPIQLGKLKVDSGKAMDFIRLRLKVLSGTRETYATFFGYQGAMTIIVLCLSGAVLVGNDFAQRGVAFFLAKPIRPWHYLAGKFLAIATVVNLLTTLPALVLYAQQASNNWDLLLDADFFRASGGTGPAGWPLLGGIVLYGALLSVVLGLILLASAALVQRTMPLILVWASLFLFLRALSQSLVDRLEYDAHWRLLDLWNSLGLLGQACLGFDRADVTPKSQPSFLAAAAVLGGVCALCLILLRRRMTKTRNRSLLLTTPAVAEKPLGAVVLSFERVSKWHGPVLGLNQVTLDLRPGITGLVGHNGAGKSTLLNLAAGLTRPDLGRVTVDGLDAWTPDAKHRLGFVPELDAFPEDMSARKFLVALARFHGMTRTEAVSRVEESLALVGMTDRADRPLGGYSKGMRQRVKLAQAILHDPPLLLLDEPLNGIDPVGRRDMVALFGLLAERGKCLLISSHELDALERLTDQIAILTAGRLAAVGAVSQIRELLDDHPHAIRIACDQLLPLSRRLLEWDNVLGLDRDDTGLTIRVRQPKVFFERFAALVREEQIEVTRLETLDDRAHDVLGYLLGGRRTGK